MGGRGAKNGDAMNVPFDSWGTVINHKPIKDKDGNTIGYINDEVRADMEEDIRPTTKKEVLRFIDDWRDDDGTWSDDDMRGYISYKDGSFVDVSDLNGKNYKKQGIVGAYISTPDYEAAWGEEYNSGKRKFEPLQTWSEDGESGRSNTYSGYKSTSMYRVRVKTTYNNPDGKGGYRTKTEVIRRSTKKPIS